MRRLVYQAVDLVINRGLARRPLLGRVLLFGGPRKTLKRFEQTNDMFPVSQDYSGCCVILGDKGMET